jgi:uncharacterized SAM-binding protein YcdF (DUF218 family)
MDEIAPWLRVIAKALVLPPTGPIVVALAGLALLRAAPRTGRVLAWSGVLALYLLSLPIVASWLARPYDAPPLDLRAASQAQAIVILGGGLRRAAPEYGGDTLARLTAERVRYGARVAKQTALPVLVTGGVPWGARASEAQVMRDALEREYGVPVQWVEGRSRNTRENARHSATLLKGAGVTTVVLVAHAFDMPRARGEFADQGVATIPAPTGLLPPLRPVASDFLPSVPALQLSHDALYEALANAARALGL